MSERHDLVVRGATVIDGTGAPPIGPTDIVVENNRIAEIKVAGTPGLPLKPGREPRWRAAQAQQPQRRWWD